MKLFSILGCVALTAVTAFQVSAKEHLKSLNPSEIDAATPATEDFYRHTNKGWMDSHPLTPEYARYGKFNILNDSSNNRVQRIVTHLKSTNPAKGTDAYKIAYLYEMGMDSLRRNELGAQPIKDAISRIQGAKPEEMEDLFMWMTENYGSPFISYGFQEDLANSTKYAMYLGGTSLTLGDRDYYLLNDKKNKDIRAAYEKLIRQQMMNAGFSKKEASRIVKNVLKIETLIADSTWTREQSRNIPALYNPVAKDELKKIYSNIPFDRLDKEYLKLESPDVIIVTTPNTVEQCNKLYGTLSDREKKDYYLWMLVNGASSFLSDDFADANFEFNKVMSGVQEKRPRWKTALGVTEGIMGEGIGKLYVEQYFPESSKLYMQDLVENLRNSLGKHIINLPWMSDDTKVQAMKKLSNITVKIGYPDKWRDYSLLNVDPELSYWENVHNANLWAQDRYLEKWGKPVDRTEWGMTPQTINAYYNPLFNEIVFPAGILQAPFFDADASDAENYGGIGVVIGHELTHGFDDQGCNFDADGNMVNWWTENDKNAFDNLAQGLVEQFNAIEVLPGLNANGQYTLGENIADQGGLRIAYTAFLDSQKKKNVDITSEEAKIDGFDPTQVYYMNFANLWAQNVRPEEVRSLTIGDVHSLGENRVNVSLKNLEPFMKAFNVKEGDKMWLPEDQRVIIW